MNIHFERIYTSFGVKCYAMRSLRINKKTVTQRFTQFNHRPQSFNIQGNTVGLSPWVKSRKLNCAINLIRHQVLAVRLIHQNKQTYCNLHTGMHSA